MTGADLRLATVAIRFLSAKGIVIGLNEPYSGVSEGYSAKRHGLAQGIPHVQLEIRQDLIDSADRRIRWTSVIGELLDEITSQSMTYRIEHW
jgi:predicted N-formylglutamate amidohydrolase